MLSATPGSGRVQYMVEGQTAPQLFSVLVRDSGPGIATEDQQRIFDEFSQVEHPLQRRTWLLATLSRLTAAGHGLRQVLIVDDQEPMRVVLRQLVDGRHFQVLEAATGASGLQRAQDDAPDVILLDLGLPAINGREVLKRLKENAATQRIPVVLVTSARLDAAERAQLVSAAAGFVPKDSLTRERLDEALRKALASAESASNG